MSVCVALLVYHPTLLSTLNWNICIYGKFDPFYYISETCERIFLSAPICHRNKICCGQHCIYFKMIWWSQNLSTQKVCGYTVVGNSSSEGIAIHSNIWDRTDSITSKLTDLVPTPYTQCHFVYTEPAQKDHRLGKEREQSGSASLFPQSCMENLCSWSSKTKTKHIPEWCQIPTNITGQDW